MADLFTRYAPTPSGYLHLGNIYNFFLIQKEAERASGKILLRIDDFDQLRTEDQYIEDIFQTLDWLNLKYDIGPTLLTDLKTKWSQSLKKEYYFSRVQKLLKEDALFVCSCSRQTQVKCDCSTRKIDFSPKKNVIRAKIPTSPVVWRREDIPSYHLVSILEDDDNKIKLIIRGEDLLESTAIQIELAKIFNLQHFLKAKFIHHKLLTDSNGNKLSKSNNGDSIYEMRNRGLSPNEVISLVSTILRT